MNNKKTGTKFENRFAELLSEKGFWVHLLQQNSYGQPADVIAVKDNKAYLIDCKVCSNNSFPLSRIEDNQELAMRKWQVCKNSTPWFALEYPDESIKLISFNSLMMMKDMGINSIGKIRAKKIGYSLEEWINVVNSKQ